MEELDVVSVKVQTPLDRFAIDLQQLREEQGISYTDLASRVTALRMGRGMQAVAARTPRSTVYTCFRIGRVRIDTDLLRDIALALTGDEEQSRHWVSRYLDARRQSVILRGNVVSPTTKTPDAVTDASPTLAPVPVPTPAPILAPATLSSGTVMLVVLSAVLINRLGMGANSYFGFSLFLDMIGTCAAAIILGPWYGVAVAVLYHGFVMFSFVDPGALFVLVNITGALVWGYGVRRFQMGDSVLRYTLLGIATAVACSAVGIPINIFLNLIDAWSGLGASIGALEATGVSFEAALVSVNITASLIDKFLAGFIALVLFVYLHRHHGVPAAHMPLVEQLGALQNAGRPEFRFPLRTVLTGRPAHSPARV